MKRNTWKLIVGAVAVTIAIGVPRIGQARYYSEWDRNLSLQLEYRMENYFGIEGPSSMISQRNELKLEVEYDNFLRSVLERGRGRPRFDFYAQLRPWYDTVSNMETSGMSTNSFLHRNWRTNLDWRNDSNDPFLREIYVDVNWGDFYGRLGRQIIAWGKSDGVFMLDLINPFNFRVPFIFEEEDIKIPHWMLNLNYRIGQNGTFQMLWIPWYVNAMYPGFRPKETIGGQEVFLQGGATGDERRRHAFEFNGISFANEFYQGLDFLYREEFGIPEGLPVRPQRPAKNLENSMVALRWSHVFGDLAYTFNYFYGWTSFMFDYTDTGNFVDFASVTRKPGRLHIIGGSWDYPIHWAPGILQGLVWRGETALFINDLFINADSNSDKFFVPDRVDHLGLMMGFDNSYNIDLFPWAPRSYIDPTWTISLQYWQDWFLDPIRAKNAYFDYGGGTPNWANNYGEGRRDDIKSQITLFILKDMLPGDVLHWEFFVLYGISFNDWWLRVRARYELTDNLNVAIGLNEFLGGRYDPWGQFGGRSHVWTELRYVPF